MNKRQKCHEVSVRLLSAALATAVMMVAPTLLWSGCGSGTVSTDTTDGGTNCGAGSTLCGSSCVDTATDNANCGACGAACASGKVCSDSACSASCPEGLTICSGTCVNEKTDNANCGACGTACPSGNACTAGACAVSCLAGLTKCGSTCVNEKTDNANCGACGTACPSGQVCSAGVCGTSCAAPQTLCAPDGGASYCSDLQTDDGNCGGCGTACPSGQVCSAGACTTSCAAPQTLCAPDGGATYCAALQTDDANCGGCGTVCPIGQGCLAGTCMAGCFLGGNGTACARNAQCASDVCTAGACQVLGALALIQVDTPYIAIDAFYNGTTYTYLAFGPTGTMPTVVGGTGVAIVVHAGGGVNPESSFMITSTTTVTSITSGAATRATFTVHQGSIFFDGTFDPNPANATHTIPTGQSAAYGVGFSEDLGASNWYASVDGVQTPYTTNVHVHSFIAPISPGETHAVMGAGYTNGALGIQAAYWGYSNDLVTCP